MNNPHEYFHDMYLNTTTEIFVDLKKKKSGVSWLSNIVGNKQTKKKKTKMAVWERKKKERKQITGKICTQTRAQSS